MRAELNIALADYHFPNNNKDLWVQVLRWIRKHQPKRILIVGDFADFEWASRHGGNPDPPTAEEECKPVRKALRELKDAAPGADIIYIAGNHEDRLNRWVADQARPMHGHLSIEGLLHLEQMGIRFIKYGSGYTLGKLLVTHGHYTNEHHAAKHLRKFGCSVLYGHVHRAQMFTEGGRDGALHGGFAMPAGCDPDPDYMRGAPTGWMYGFGVVWSDPRSGRFAVQYAFWFNGAFLCPLSGELYGNGVGTPPAKNRSSEAIRSPSAAPVTGAAGGADFGVAYPVRPGVPRPNQARKPGRETRTVPVSGLLGHRSTAAAPDAGARSPAHAVVKARRKPQ